ncbi:MAG TPA: MBL fold metallo-hydrolase [Geminicoccus sp.]|jgi:glyoxylase-like metal-dependent hydrolase (beta-lactamase superfamily II)|uniref:MBL fold metallo-hydrolase n=1 Tax=Geminicoccus sp. TaxID=2024832 RepID=UPI002E35D5DE|nr:MBL fold metallo-hydrolase [Geminicoccus sp.]HEX2527631.1 MBL fold metallo-hydrolase [Geminicoccus sp.]
MQRVAIEVPEPGKPVAVADGIFWLRLKLPFALDHVNLWIVDDGSSWTLIDTGLGDATTKAIWDDLLAGLLHGRPVRRVLATHFHPDHAGNIGSLVERTGAELLMSRTEWLTARMLVLDTSDDFVASGRRFDLACALPEDLIESRSRRGNYYRRNVDPIPYRFTRLQAGDRLELAGTMFEVIVGEGHSPEQVTLHSRERNLLIAADQVLPSISPNVAVWPSEPDADPLGAFQRTLARYVDVADDAMVLPSHKTPFTGLQQRIEQLQRHHDERLEATLAACRQPSKAVEVMVRLFPRALDMHQLSFALGETLAHLNRLVVSRGIVKETDAAGVNFYRAA